MAFWKKNEESNSTYPQKEVFSILNMLGATRTPNTTITPKSYDIPQELLNKDSWIDDQLQPLFENDGIDVGGATILDKEIAELLDHALASLQVEHELRSVAITHLDKSMGEMTSEIKDLCKQVEELHKEACQERTSAEERYRAHEKKNLNVAARQERQMQ